MTYLNLITQRFFDFNEFLAHWIVEFVLWFVLYRPYFPFN